MFEVMITYRPDFKEAPLDRYPTEAEAQERACAIALRHPDKVLRAWVRTTTAAGAESPEQRGNRRP